MTSSLFRLDLSQLHTGKALATPESAFPGLTVEMANLLQLLVMTLPSAIVKPVPLATWADLIAREYSKGATSTLTRMKQACREAIALAPPGATTLDLTEQLVADFSRRPGAAATTQGLMRGLKRACRLAARWGQLGVVPFSPDTPWPRGDGYRDWRHHSFESVGRYLTHLASQSETWKGHRLYALAAVYAYTGLRRNEGLSLQREDIRLNQRILVVKKPANARLKTEASAAAVPIPDALEPILRDWMPRSDKLWMFPGVMRVGRWSAGHGKYSAAANMKAAGESIGLQGMTPHSLRRSLATHLRGRHKLSREQVQMVLRHSDVFTQELYVCEDLANLAALVRDFRY